MFNATVESIRDSRFSARGALTEALGNMSDVGIYIVTLSNEHPISVNAHDPRIADRCVTVTRANCKVGRAQSFIARERSYHKTFGAQHVTFEPIAYTSELLAAERVILKALLQWRLRSPSKRRTEWLEGISASEARQQAIAALRFAGIPFSSPRGAPPKNQPD